MRKSTVIVIVLIAFVVGYAFGALSSPVKEYVYQVSTKTLTVTEEKTTTVTSTYVAAEERILEVCFSAVEDCSSLIRKWIARANESIYVMIYSFTQDEIGEALVKAVERGVDVEVIFEEQQLSKYSEFERLRKAGAEVYLDGNPNAMHHKVAIIDGWIVITGSYNWSRSAEERNDENLIVLAGRDIAGAYMNEFERVRSEATPA